MSARKEKVLLVRISPKWKKQVLNILEQYKDIGSGPVDFNSPKIDYGGVFESRLDVIEKLYIDFCSRNYAKKEGIVGNLPNMETWSFHFDVFRPVGISVEIVKGLYGKIGYDWSSERLSIWSAHPDHPNTQPEKYFKAWDKNFKAWELKHRKNF